LRQELAANAPVFSFGASRRSFDTSMCIFRNKIFLKKNSEGIGEIKFARTFAPAFENNVWGEERA
jgi:hypothetical protein